MTEITPFAAFGSSIRELPLGISARTAQYQYVTTDLRTNTLISEIELTNVSYTRKLSSAGEANAEFSVPTDLVEQLRAATSPGRTGLYILRDGRPMWGGIIWKRAYTRSTRRVSLAASSFESYFAKRFQNQTLAFAQEDQLDIARTILGDAPAHIGIDVSSALSGVLRDRVMFDYEFKTRGEELDQLSNLINGFDWNVVVSVDTSGTLRRTLVFGYPYLGVSAANTAYVFEYPGNISDFTISEDADGGGNTVWAIGGGEGEDQLETFASDTVSISNGFPILETSRSYKSVVSPTTLQGHADEDLAQLKVPVTVATVDVRPNDDPALGSYSPGDFANFIIDDPWLDGRQVLTRRITGFTVQVSDAGGPETVSLSFDTTERTQEDTAVY